jgi:hypothetical protein
MVIGHHVALVIKNYSRPEPGVGLDLDDRGAYPFDHGDKGVLKVRDARIDGRRSCWGRSGGGRLYGLLAARRHEKRDESKGGDGAGLHPCTSRCTRRSHGHLNGVGRLSISQGVAHASKVFGGVAGIQGHWSVRRSSIGPKLIQRSSPPIRQPDSCSAVSREFGRNHLLTYAMSVLMRQSPHQ